MVTHFSPRTGKFNGIFAYINTNYFNNFSNYINCTSTGGLDSTHSNYQEIFPPHGSNHVVQNTKNAAYTFTFKTFLINITSYSIKHGGTLRFLSDWKLEASFNGSKYETIHQISNCSQCVSYNVMNFKLNHGVYNSFRLTKLNTNSDGTDFFDLHGFEIFGTICNPVSCEIVNDFIFTVQRMVIFRPFIFLFLYLF